MRDEFPNAEGAPVESLDGLVGMEGLDSLYEHEQSKWLVIQEAALGDD